MNTRLGSALLIAIFAIGIPVMCGAMDADQSDSPEMRLRQDQDAFAVSRGYKSLDQMRFDVALRIRCTPGWRLRERMAFVMADRFLVAAGCPSSRLTVAPINPFGCPPKTENSSDK